MTPGLYLMKYHSGVNIGGGAMYIGHGIVSGVDIGEMRYSGNYTVDGEFVIVSAKMTATIGVELVTGASLPAGTTLDVSAQWPLTFADGKPVAINVMGFPVQVSFEKVSDLP